MSGKTIVILGGGIGGLVVANELQRLVHPEHRIVFLFYQYDAVFRRHKVPQLIGGYKPANTAPKNHYRLRSHDS